jgi:hypothetical protein
MAKTVVDQLMALLSADEQKILRAKLDANPALIAQDKKSSEIYSIYQGEDVEEVVPAATATTAPVTEPVKPAAVAAPVTPTATVTASASPNDAILAELRNLSTSIDTRLAEMGKKFVSVDKLPEYQESMLASAIRAADDIMTVKQRHRTTFGKELDRDAFEKFVNENQAAGVKFKNMNTAWEAFTQKDTTELEITRRVAEGIKQKKSGDDVPGQTQSVGLSAAQQVMKKARDGAKSADGKSNAMAAAERLAQIDRGREESGAGAVN